MKFDIEVKAGPKSLASIKGRATIDPKVSELQRIPELEKELERLTGYRWHIDAVET